METLREDGSLFPWQLPWRPKSCAGPPTILSEIVSFKVMLDVLLQVWSCCWPLARTSLSACYQRFFFSGLCEVTFAVTDHSLNLVRPPPKQRLTSNSNYNEAQPACQSFGFLHMPHCEWTESLFSDCRKPKKSERVRNGLNFAFISAVTLQFFPQAVWNILCRSKDASVSKSKHSALLFIQFTLKQPQERTSSLSVVQLYFLSI